MREAFVLPDAACERATRTEMNALKMLISFVSIANYGRDDLKKRLGMIPDGNDRYSIATCELNDVLQDVIGTVSTRQAQQLLNTVKDMEIRLVPKFTSEKITVAMRRDDFEELVDCAREKCKFCTEDARTCLKCKLYQILEAQVPLEDYNDDGISCPYAYREWGR